jgi:hypothetical protein
MAIVTSFFRFFVLQSAYQEQAVHELGLVCLDKSNRNADCEDFQKLSTYNTLDHPSGWFQSNSRSVRRHQRTTASYILQASLT